MSAPVKLVGVPDGPSKFVAELGCEVGTFSQHTGGKTLGWHVPLEMRGDFRPKDLANVDSEKDYRTDALGYLLCYGYTNAGERCRRRAQNRWPRCISHGGALHPLDKVEKSVDNTKDLTRYQMFCKGQLTVHDLDDEELAMCGFRGKNGTIYRPKNVPREMAQEFQKIIFERAQAQLRSLTVKAAETVGEIMLKKTNEPDIRLKAAFGVLERNLGKTPTVVALTSDKPFEEVFSDVFTGSREESRKRRAITSERIQDAEEVDLTTGLSEPEYHDAPESVAGQHDSDNSSNVDRQENTGATGIDFGLTADSAEGTTDARLFERNDAILAQAIEIKPFEYDLTDNRDAIQKATKKRYASRALGVDLDEPVIPFIRKEKLMKDGTIWVKYIDPTKVSTAGPTKSDNQNRKAYTLNDFD